MKIGEFTPSSARRDGIFLFTTDHQLRQLIFRCGEDFIYGVNTLAIGTLKIPVRILCYALMDNHLHLLLMGRYEDCLAYFRWVLHRLSMMLKNRYGVSGLLKAEAADVQEITDDRMLLNEIAYLYRNPYKARIGSPFSYAWTPFEVYFNPYRDAIRGERFRSADEARNLLGTHAEIPMHWEHLQGRIMNKCFVDYKTVERRVGSSLALFDRIRRFNLESVIAQAHGVEEQLTFTDSEMQEKIQALCRNEWHVESPHQLNRKDLLQLARSLAYRFASPSKQISRLLGIDPSVLDQAL